MQELYVHNLNPLNTYFGQRPVPEDVEKHLTLLDAISLPLIARRSDVAAIGIVIDMGYELLQLILPFCKGKM
ncbi:hypothetical protein BDZ91DRAFT_725745 [Kalaharituber pfeilii]|nr:hypothetical protein BDZ91DRAFT_725745 [Kalaharituber pfeilii]